MITVILIGIYLIIFIYAFYKYAHFKPKGFPPGPPRIPLVGSYLFMLAINYNYLHKAAIILCKFYKSDIIGFYLGDFPVVVVHNYNGIKEMLYNEEFNGRPDVFMGRIRDPHFQKRGLTLNDGDIWKNQRRFMLRYLRDFGFGRRSEKLENLMNDEFIQMIDILKNGLTSSKLDHISDVVKKEKALCPYFISYYVLTSLLYIFCNERIPTEERKEFIQMARNAMIFHRNGDDYGKLISIIPWIHKIFPKLTGYSALRESSQYLIKFFNRIVEKYSKTFDENQEDRNFIDMYLRQIKKTEITGDSKTPFTHDEFIMGLFDFIFAASTTVPTQISFMLQWLLIRPDILEKIQHEIDLIVGKERLPNIDDRKHMPYTDAAIRESMRISTILPSGLLHKAILNTKLMGYIIPKDTLIAPGIYAFHNNKEIWTDPKKFRPERFLDQHGKLSLKKDISLPFGAGKRLCAGETFARNFMFLFITSICQNFNIILGENDKLPDMSKTVNGIIQSPSDFWLNLKIRVK